MHARKHARTCARTHARACTVHAWPRGAYTQPSPGISFFFSFRSGRDGTTTLVACLFKTLRFVFLLPARLAAIDAVRLYDASPVARANLYARQTSLRRSLWPIHVVACDVAPSSRRQQPRLSLPSAHRACAHFTSSFSCTLASHTFHTKTEYTLTHTTHNTQHTQHTNTQHTTHNTQHTTHNTQHTTHNTQHATHKHYNRTSRRLTPAWLGARTIASASSTTTRRSTARTTLRQRRAST
jgi:hypothetical protein